MGHRAGHNRIEPVALDLLGAANEAADIDALAARAVPPVARCAGASHAMLTYMHAGRLRAFGAISPMGRFGETDYQRHYMAADPVLAANLAAGPGVVRSSQLMDYRRFKRTALFDAVYRRQRASTVMFCRFAMADKRGAYGLALMRATGERDFSSADETRVRKLVPIVGRAWQRLLREEQVARTAALLQQLLAEVDPRPRIVFDADGDRVWASAAATKLLAGRVPRHLSALSPPPGRGAAGYVTLARPGGGPVRATLHRHPDRRGGHHVAVLEDYSAPTPRIDALAREAGLTPAETRTLAALASRRSTRQMADSLCVSVATVRTHVKRVLAKLDVHSRAELIARVEGRPPD